MRTGDCPLALLSRTATLPPGRSATSTHELVLHRELRRQAIGWPIVSAAPASSAVWPPAPSSASHISLSVSSDTSATSGVTPNACALAGGVNVHKRLRRRRIRRIRWPAEARETGQADATSNGLVTMRDARHSVIPVPAARCQQGRPEIKTSHSAATTGEQNEIRTSPAAACSSQRKPWSGQPRALGSRQRRRIGPVRTAPGRGPDRRRR